MVAAMHEEDLTSDVLSNEIDADQVAAKSQFRDLICRLTSLGEAGLAALAESPEECSALILVQVAEPLHAP